MKRLLITGKGSYLGLSLARFLSREPERFRTDCVSLRTDDWQAMSFAGFDAVYHTAAIVHQPGSKEDPRELERYRRVNRDLAVAVAKKAKEEGVPQFLFLSTMAVYGLTAAFGKTVTITAQTPTVPVDNYGRSKLEAEEALLKLADDRFRVAILRPPMIYGRGCKGNFQTLCAIAGKLPCFPAVSNRRSMLYVDNLNQLVRLLIEGGEGGIFCPQDRDFVNTSDMIRAIAQAQGKHLVLLPGLAWGMGLLRPFTGAVDKAFGSLCYDQTLSEYKEDYRIYSYPETLRLSVQNERSNTP